MNKPTLKLNLNEHELCITATAPLVDALSSLTITSPSSLVKDLPDEYDGNIPATTFMLLLFLFRHFKQLQSLTVGEQTITEPTVKQIDRACCIYALKSGFSSFVEAIQSATADLYEPVKLSETETGLLFWLTAEPLEANWLNMPMALGINLDSVRLDDIIKAVKKNQGPDKYTHDEHAEFIKSIIANKDQFIYGPYVFKAVQYETCEYVLTVSVNGKVIDFLPFASCDYELEQRTRETAGYWLLDHELD